VGGLSLFEAAAIANFPGGCGWKCPRSAGATASETSLCHPPLARRAAQSISLLIDGPSGAGVAPPASSVRCRACWLWPAAEG